MVKRKIIPALLLAFFAFKAFPQETDAQTQPSPQSEASQPQLSEPESQNNDPKAGLNPSLVVTKINFIGLKKTRDSYIQSRVKKFLNKTVQETDLRELFTVLQVEGLFNDAKIAFSQTGETQASIDITVEEKITFIPLPFIAASSSGLMGGAVVLDTNAFGVKDMFMVGGFLSSETKTGMASFSKPPRENFIPGFGVNVSVAQNKPVFANVEDEEVLRYKNFSYSGGFSLSERLGEHFNVIIGASFKSVSVDEKNPQVDSIKVVISSVGASFSISDWNGVFLSSTTASFRFSSGLSDSNDDDLKYPKEFAGSLTFQKPLIPVLRANAALSGFCGQYLHKSSWRGKGEAAVTLLPGDFKSSRLGGGYAGLEWAFHKGKFSQLALYANYEAACVFDYDREYEFVHGPSGGMKVYLSKVAFPALAVGLTYNIPKNYWQFAAALGVSM